MPSGQFPVILAGTDYTAALIQALGIIYMRKDADTPRSNTTTLAADTDLSFTGAANGIYHIVGWVAATGAAIGSGDLKAAWGTPAGASGIWTGLGYATSGTTVNLNAARALASTNPFGVNGATFSAAFIFASVTLTTGGTVSFQWAQNTSSATATTLKGGSWLAAVRSQ